MKKININKIASMELSINTIVILVIAIAILGLGLAFTKNMFGKLRGSFSVPTPEYEATASEPIVLATDEIPLSKSKPTDLPVSIYNACGDVLNTLPKIECASSAAGGSPIEMTVTGLAATINPGEQKQLKLLVQATGAVDPGRTSCRITVSCGAGKKTYDKSFYGMIQS